MHAALKPQTFQWHCASAGQEIPCPACEGTNTNWLGSDAEGDTWGCACGFDFVILVEEITPVTAYQVGRAVFTEYGMALQYANQDATGSIEPLIEEIDLYSDLM
jgi:hypothetical protein